MIHKIVVLDASMQTEHGLAQIDVENSDDQLLHLNELIGTEDCVGDLLQVQQQQKPQYPIIEVEMIENIFHVQQMQQVQELLPQSQLQVQQHSEQIKQTYGKEYLEIAEVNFSRRIMWEQVIQQEILQLEQQSVFPLNVHIATDYEDLPELIN